jgi:hypothetical protein
MTKKSVFGKVIVDAEQATGGKPILIFAASGSGGSHPIAFCLVVI